MNLTYTTIIKAVSDYIDAKAAYEEFMSDPGKLVPPTIPDVITCQEDYDQYEKQLHEYYIQRDALTASSTSLENNKIRAYNSLSYVLPLENVWFKIEINGDVYAVAKECNEYEEYLKVLVMDWVEPLPQLNKPFTTVPA